MAHSWSGVRKQLEKDYLCDALKGRVRYHITRFHAAPDRYGRAAIYVDGKARLWASSFAYTVKGYDGLARRLKQAAGTPRRVWQNGGMLHDGANATIEKRVKGIAMARGHFEVSDLTEAIGVYLGQDIGASLASANPLVCMLAVLDRRVGKRTLQKLKGELEHQPPWLLWFYQLRLGAEGIGSGV